MKTLNDHNPRCSKNCQALRFLPENSIEPIVINDLETLPAPEELARLCGLLTQHLG